MRAVKRLRRRPLGTAEERGESGEVGGVTRGVSQGASTCAREQGEARTTVREAEEKTVDGGVSRAARTRAAKV